MIATEKLERAAFLLKTIAHPTRLSVVMLLVEKPELSVNEICEATRCEQSLISHHLNGMKLKGVLSSRRSGKQIYYSLKMKELSSVLHCIENAELITSE